MRNACKTMIIINHERSGALRIYIYIYEITSRPVNLSNCYDLVRLHNAEQRGASARLSRSLLDLGSTHMARR